MFQSVLVPLDGSAFAEQALPLAVSVAQHAGATLRLLRVVPPLEDSLFWAPEPGTALESELREQHRTAAKAYLDGVVSRLKDASTLSVICDVIDEKEGISETISADVAKTGAGLIVLTSHGRGAVARFWLGSVADELVRTSPVPVLLVRPPEQPPLPDFQKPVVLKHFLLALGGNMAVERIVEPALAIGKAMDADYTLVRVIRPNLEYVPSFYYPDEGAGLIPASGSVESEKINEQKRQEAEKYLQRVAERLRADGAQVQARTPIAEQPAVAILEEAVRCGADLIALETHGRGLSRVLMGSVADKVIRGSSLPVLVCRYPRTAP